MGFLANFFQSVGEEQCEITSDLLEIEAILGAEPESRAQFLSSFAMLLGRVAYADMDISEQEEILMREILIRELNMSDQVADAVCRLAIKKNIEMSLENHIVLRRIKELSSEQEKDNVMRALFSLAAADDISMKEDNEIRLVAMSIGLSHERFIRLRSEFSEHLSVLKGIPS